MSENLNRTRPVHGLHREKTFDPFPGHPVSSGPNKAKVGRHPVYRSHERGTYEVPGVLSGHNQNLHLTPAKRILLHTGIPFYWFWALLAFCMGRKNIGRGFILRTFLKEIDDEIDNPSLSKHEARAYLRRIQRSLRDPLSVFENPWIKRIRKWVSEVDGEALASGLNDFISGFALDIRRKNSVVLSRNAMEKRVALFGRGSMALLNYFSRPDPPLPEGFTAQLGKFYIETDMFLDTPQDWRDGYINLFSEEMRRHGLAPKADVPNLKDFYAWARDRHRILKKLSFEIHRNLHRLPFGIRTWYLKRIFIQRLKKLNRARLLFGIEEVQGPVMITGPTNAGKTTLAGILGRNGSRALNYDSYYRTSMSQGRSYARTRLLALLKMTRETERSGSTIEKWIWEGAHWIEPGWLMKTLRRLERTGSRPVLVILEPGFIRSGLRFWQRSANKTWIQKIKLFMYWIATWFYFQVSKRSIRKVAAPYPHLWIRDSNESNVVPRVKKFLEREGFEVHRR